MIDYDEGNWAVAFIFQLHGSVVPKALVWAVPAALMSGLLRLLVDDDTVAEFEDVATTSSTLSFVLGFLIVFRTQKAYDRWWSAGQSLNEVRADWFNAYSSLVAFGNQDPALEKQLESWVHEIARYFSLLYGCALIQCSTSPTMELEFIDFSGVDTPHLRHLLNTHDKCELVLQWIQRCIVEADQNGLIKIAPPILSRVYNQLGSGIVKLTSARQIKAFPIPFLLAQMITALMLIHWVSNSVVSALSLQSVFTAMLVCFLGQMCFWGVHYIAVEMEGPYGGEANDLCLEDMQLDINKSLLAMADPLARKLPTFEHDHDKPLARVSLDLNLELEGMCEQIVSRRSQSSKPLPSSKPAGDNILNEVAHKVAELCHHGHGADGHVTEAATLNGHADGGTTDKVRPRASSTPPTRVLGTYSM